MKIRCFSDRSPQRWVLLAVVMILVTGACKKNNDGGGTAGQTLKDFFSSSVQYTLFNRALQRTHLDSLLGGATPYTVFAVGDSAMSAGGYTAAAIDTANIGVLTGLLRYHIVPGSFASTDVQLYQETILTTADSNFQAYLEYNNFGLFYNGIPLVNIDNRMLNGIVQHIQTMAHPPIGDLATTIRMTPGLRDFSYILTEAVNNGNIGVSYNQIIPYISGTPSAPLTIFLPDDNYFVSLGLDSYTAILQQGGRAVALMSQGQSFTSDFVGENKITGGFGLNPTIYQLWFSEDGASFYTMNASGSIISSAGHYRITQANIVTTNGIIHLIESY